MFAHIEFGAQIFAQPTYAPKVLNTWVVQCPTVSSWDNQLANVEDFTTEVIAASVWNELAKQESNWYGAGAYLLINADTGDKLLINSLNGRLVLPGEIKDNWVEKDANTLNTQQCAVN